MSVDWRTLTRAAGLRLDGHAIDVTFADDRRQRVFVEDAGEAAIRIWSVVAKPSVVSGLKEPNVDAWRRNRLTELVGFSVDSRGRMIGEAWVPVAGLEADEWQFQVRNLARACDRLEYLMTGADEA